MKPEHKGRILPLLLMMTTLALVITVMTGGLYIAVVMSGSMEPAISVDDLIVAIPQGDYRIGDIITYEQGTHRITHRIVGETAAGYITKGDANNVHDSQPVPPQAVVGRVTVAIPAVGWAVRQVKTPAGLAVILGAIGLTLIRPTKGNAEEENDHEG